MGSVAEWISAVQVAAVSRLVEPVRGTCRWSPESCARPGACLLRRYSDHGLKPIGRRVGWDPSLLITCVGARHRPSTGGLQSEPQLGIGARVGCLGTIRPLSPDSSLAIPRSEDSKFAAARTSGPSSRIIAVNASGSINHFSFEYPRRRFGTRRGGPPAPPKCRTGTCLVLVLGRGQEASGFEGRRASPRAFP